ncbi:MAG TPA: site-2 protease family protein [Anaeromyxobacter sp.]|nr:site-2 protease family protein [Anaeromyxobacter sp.]
MDNALIVERVLNLIVLLLSLTFHEFFHAWSAWRLGDDTAARMGRLTLNPVPHIDVFGTIILPLLNAPIGWAKPVPVNPARFRRGVRMATGDIIVSSAGPLSNLLLGLVAAIAFGLLKRFSPETVVPGTAAYALLAQFMLVNAGLAVFNLLPIPPLDGGHVAASLMPYRWRGAWEQFARYSPFLLILLVVGGSRVLFPPIRFVFELLWTLKDRIAA